MTALLFLGYIAAVVLMIMAIEGNGERALRHRPAGLLAWLTGGNWPAKVGAALIVVGIGALLRYSMLRIDIPAQAKLGSGVLIAAALGFASAFLPGGPARRTVSLALGGAAFGVGYLTAYSAFALFGYVPSATGLALLALVSAGAGAYAVTRGAMALAILAMFGAYLAPAFAVEDPGPLVTYGYYAAASAMTLVLVALRGWRPLMHLSFLFTLAGGAFLAWTSRYYDQVHANAMMPMLLLLSALHVAMPVAERGGQRPAWSDRLDVLYMLALPSVVTVLTLFITPSRTEFAIMMLWFSAIWAAAAEATWLRRRNGVAALSAIAILFLILAAAARFQDIPWQLLGLAASVVSLALATWRRPGNTSLHSITAGFVAVFGYLHVLSGLDDNATGVLFANSVFLSRLVGALLLISAGILCRRARQVLDTLLLATGVLWLLIAVGIELIRVDLATLALVVNWLFILVAASVWIPGRKVRWADNSPMAVAVLLALTSSWAAKGAGYGAALITIMATAVAGLALAARPARLALPNSLDRSGSVLGTIAAVALWGFAFGPAHGPGGLQFILVLAVITAIAAMALMHAITDVSDRCTEELIGGTAISLAVALGVATLLHLSRETWAVALEACCLAGIALAFAFRSRRGGTTTALLASLTVGTALVAQAWLVRWLAAPGPLGFSSVFDLRQPALISLLWAGIGCALTYRSRRAASRPLWIAGASLLIATAAKMVLLDFGSLGQLTNILAVIAAGIVFLAVGWLAPMPPAAAKTATARGQYRDMNRLAISIAILVGLIELTPLQRLRAPLPSNWTAPIVASAMAAEAAQPLLPGTPIQAPAEETGGATVEEPVSPTEAAARDPIPEPLAAAPSPATPDPRREWVRPPVIGADGVRNYNDLSYPVRKAAQEDAAHNDARQDDAPIVAPPSPGEGEQGLNVLVRQGRLMRATQKDLDEYLSQVRGDPGATKRLNENNRMILTQPLRNVYIVRGEMTVPSGLYGAHAVMLIVPRGVPYPFGNPGHSSILEYPSD